MNITRTAGLPQTFDFVPPAPPVAPPTLTIYSDAARTAVVAAAIPLSATVSSRYMAHYPDTLVPGTYYLRFTCRFDATEPDQIDDSHTLTLTPYAGTLS